MLILLFITFVFIILLLVCPVKGGVCLIVETRFVNKIISLRVKPSNIVI